MKADIRPIRTKYTFQLVKWEGDVPGCLEIKEPQKDRRCLEIIEWELGQPTKTIYKRTE